MSEIQSLNLRVQDLNRSVDFWNTAMIWALVFAAIAAVAVVVTTWVALTRAKQLAEAGEKLISAKDKQLALDLKDRDLKIAELGGKTAEANKKAEEERLARVKIEERLAGWKLNSDAQKTLAKKAKLFPGTPFDLFVNPVEVAFMDTLDGLLTSSGWVRQVPKQSNDQQPFNVLIDGKAAVTLLSGISIEIAQERWNVFGPALTVLAEGLRAEGIPVKAHLVAEGSDPNAIHIVIGRRE